MSRFLAFLFTLFLALPAFAQLPGLSGRQTYIYNLSGVAGTVNFQIHFASSATIGFKIAEICWTMSGATAGAAATWYAAHTSTAATGGTAISKDTSTTGPNGNITRLDKNDVAFPGIVTFNPGGGAALAGVFDQWNVSVDPIAGDSGSFDCRRFGQSGDKMPTAAPGVANGITVSSGTAGAGALAATGVRVVLIVE